MNSETIRPEPTPFADAMQRSRAQHLGLWTFIATEILFFGGMFACYAVYRVAYPAAFIAGSSRLNFWIGTINTGILLGSSLCMALADHAAKINRIRALKICLALTWVLGAVFLGLKSYEYHHKFVEHLVPGPHFQATSGAPQEQLFFLLYFALTGLHALHMLIGLGVIAWVGWRAHRGLIGPGRAGAVEMTGLYWHFVDCIWVFLYPLLYLVR